MEFLLLPLLMFILYGYSECRVEIRTTKVGDDKTIPTEGDTVAVHYTGRLTDSRIFDTSRGRSPFEFVVGQGSVINGWDVMVRYMSKGQKARVIITYDDAYGDTGIAQSNPPIPPFATLIFDVEIVAVKRAAAQNQGSPSMVQNNVATNQQLQTTKVQTGQNAMAGQIAGQVGQSALNFPAQVTGLIGQTNTAGGLATSSGIQTGVVGALPGTQFGAQQVNPLATQQQAQQFNQANLIQQLNAAAAAGVQQQPQQQFIAQPGGQTFNALNTLQTQQQLLAAQMPQQQFASQTVMQQQPQFAQAAGLPQQQTMGGAQTRGIGLPAVNTNFVSPVGQSGLAAANSQLMSASG